MLKKRKPLPQEEQFVKAVLHRCVDLGWRDQDLCRKAGIANSTWSACRNYTKSPSITTMVKVCKAVELDVRFRVEDGGE
jgi:hypothetical protein